MKPKRQTPSYQHLVPASALASKTASAASRKRDTNPELLLRRALWSKGLRYRVDVTSLPGRPDIVFTRARLAIFCDGDFWHGRQLAIRLEKLSKGHNADYWTRKIRGNVERDRRTDAILAGAGWRVLRVWETDVTADPDRVAAAVVALLTSPNACSKRGRRVARERR